MLILAFDATSPEGGVALYRDSESVGEIRADAGGKVNYSVALFEMTDRLLANAGLRDRFLCHCHRAKCRDKSISEIRVTPYGGAGQSTSGDLASPRPT
jgi:hypothetical protein